MSGASMAQLITAPRALDTWERSWRISVGCWKWDVPGSVSYDCARQTTEDLLSRRSGRAWTPRRRLECQMDRRTTGWGQPGGADAYLPPRVPDRKSTRLNSSHLGISYAVFCLKKK